MKAHDWQLQQSLLHQHSNINHVKLDRRGPDMPVIEKYPRVRNLDEWLVLLACAFAMGVVVGAGWL